MKTIIALLTTLLSMAVAQAADLYNSKELALSAFGGWVDKDDSKFAPGAGVSYFLTEHLGVGAMTHWDNYDGSFIDNLSGEGYFRWPLSRLPLAPYGVAAIGYNFETDESFETLGAGAEWRFNEKWGVFGDVRWQFNNDTDDGVAFRVGLRLVF
jgi:predicted porin